MNTAHARGREEDPAQKARKEEKEKRQRKTPEKPIDGKKNAKWTEKEKKGNEER